MADKGWIKTYRKLQDCWIWLDKEPFDKRSAWIDLLLTANHSESKIRFNGEFVTVEKGKIVTSIRKLAEKWHWSCDKVVRFLKLLEDDGMLYRQSDKTRTLLTIENYGIYQDTPNTSRTHNSTRAEHEPNTIQELRIKNNNIYNNICSNSLSDCDKKAQKEELEKNFQILYDSYPKKKGRTEAFSRYKLWVTTGKDVNGKRVKVTNRQIWNAIAKYKQEMEKKETDLEYYKNFDTFLGKQLLDYVEEEE